MNFLYPIFFWGLFSLLIPILFHLWNKKQRNIVKIGSIKWIKTATANTNSLNLSISEIPLLLLKLLLFASLTFLIVEPFYNVEEEKEFSSQNMLLVDQSFTEMDLLNDVYKNNSFQDTVFFENAVDLEQILNNLSFQTEGFDSVFVCAKNNIQLLPDKKIETSENIFFKFIPAKENNQFCFEREGNNYQYLLEDTIARYSDILCDGAFKINQKTNIKFDKKNNSLFASELFEVLKTSSKFDMDSSSNSKRFLSFDNDSEQNLVYKIVGNDSIIIFSENIKSAERQTELVKFPYLLTEFVFSQDTLGQIFNERDLRKIDQSVASILTSNKSKRTRFKEKSNFRTVSKSQFLTNYLWVLCFVLIILERIFSSRKIYSTGKTVG